MKRNGFCSTTIPPSTISPAINKNQTPSPSPSSVSGKTPTPSPTGDMNKSPTPSPTADNKTPTPSPSSVSGKSPTPSPTGVIDKSPTPSPTSDMGKSPTPSPTPVGGSQPVKVTTMAIKCLKDGWTDWMSAAHPTPTNQGDIETISGLRKKYVFCDDHMLTAIQCRIIGTNVMSADSGQKVSCDLKEGLKCLKTNQDNGQDCNDYEVRLECDCGKYIALYNLKIFIFHIFSPFPSLCPLYKEVNTYQRNSSFIAVLYLFSCFFAHSLSCYTFPCFLYLPV